jgi:amino acid transporter
MLRAEMLLPVTIVLAAIALGISEFLVTFELTPPGGEPLDEVTAADQHSYALLMLAFFAVAAMMLAVATGLRAFAFACAGFGIAALLIFLIVDLPDAGKLGTLGGDSEFTFSTAKAEPQAGFVLEAIGSVVLGLAGLAFATLRSHQLQAPLALFGRGAETDGEEPARNEPTRRRAEQAKPKPAPRSKPRTRARGDDS